MTQPKSITLQRQHGVKETTTYVNAGLIELGISQAELTDMMTHIVTTKNIFYELI
jgi:hypothetical protein